MKNQKTKTIHVNVDSNELDLFNKMFPAAKTRFVQNAIHLAVCDKNFFDKIFWCNLMVNVNQ